jgi:hypothetical protein
MGKTRDLADAATFLEGLEENIQDALTPTVYSLVGTELNSANGAIQYKTLSANTTFTANVPSGESIILMLNGGASYTVTWPSMTWISSAGNTAPTLTASDALVFWTVSSTLYGAYVGSYV